MTLRTTLERIKTDLSNRARVDGKQFNWFCYLKLFLNPAALSIVIYRFQHWLHCCGVPLVPRLLRIMNIVLFTVDIESEARIGPGLVFGHANGIVIDGQARIGSHCMLALHCTVAIGPRENMNPQTDRVVLEDHVLVGVGSRVIGNITVGHHSRIGMNAAVIDSAPPYSILVGVPARVARTDVPDGSDEPVRFWVTSDKKQPPHQE